MGEGNKLSVRLAGAMAFGFSAAVLAVPGCQPAATDAPVMDVEPNDHGHGHDHPETFSQAVAQVEHLSDTVRDAFADKDLDAAHGPLHSVDHLLDDLKSLAGKADLTEEQMVTVGTSYETLRTSFGAIDEAMHAGGEPDFDAIAAEYKEVSGKIDAAVASLEAVAGEGLHDHDGDDHGHAERAGHDDEDGEDGHDDDQGHSDNHDTDGGHKESKP